MVRQVGNGKLGEGRGCTTDDGEGRDEGVKLGIAHKPQILSVLESKQNPGEGFFAIQVGGPWR